MNRRGGDAIDFVLKMAEELDLRGPLGATLVASGDSPLMTSLMEDLDYGVMLASDIPRLRTALPWFASFLRETGRVPFIPAIGEGAETGQIYNRTTLDAFGMYIRASTPRAKAKRDCLAAKTIEGYVAVIRTFRNREARYDIAPDSCDMVHKTIHKQRLAKDGPAKDRKRCTGIRAEHLRKAAAMGYPRSTTPDIVAWAIACVALNMLLRGGEVGVSDSAPFDPNRVITWESIRWMSPRKASRWLLWLIIRVVPIKDATGESKAYPCCVSRQHDGPFGSDPVCPYDALALAWWVRAQPGMAFPLDERGHPAAEWHLLAPAPPPVRGSEAYLLNGKSDAFFSHTCGDPWCTAHVAALGKGIARLIGIPPEEVGAKCFRIGGATDWRAAEGPNGDGRVIKQRGRWASDCTIIYQRPLVEEQLHFARIAGAVESEDLEAVCADFAQQSL